MSTKRWKVIYFVTTGLVCLVAAFSAVNFSLEHPIGPAASLRGGAFAHLGLPVWFKVELTVAKILGLLAFLIPGVPAKAREFAYFGFAITFLSASIAHSSVGDGLLFRIDPLIFLGVLAVSYWSFHHLRHADASRTHPSAGVAPA
jgi:hypothetical protein